jgi:two-component system, NtrC family, response regulator HydG
MKSRILIVDDEESIQFTFKTHLSNEGHKVMTADDYYSGIKALSENEFDLVITDVILGGQTGTDILREIKNRGLKCPVIMITGEPNIETAADAVCFGAFDYLPKPIRKETLLRVTSNALRHKTVIEEKNRMEAENERYRLNLDAIFRSLQDAIITVDRDMQVLEVNETIKDICSISARKIIGRKFTEFKTSCSKSCQNVLKKILKANNSLGEFRIECGHQDHPKQVALLTGLPLKDREGRVFGAVMVIRDITRLNGLERKFKERRSLQISKMPKMS